MRNSSLRRLALSGASALLIAVAAPAHAQFGGIVYDPSNYSQNVLTAARTLQQINNQIQSLQNEAEGLINDAGERPRSLSRRSASSSRRSGRPSSC